MSCGVATQGAKLQWQVDGRVEKVIDLPDRDGKNDAMAKEYDQTFAASHPAGPPPRSRWTTWAATGPASAGTPSLVRRWTPSRPR